MNDTIKTLSIGETFKKDVIRNFTKREVITYKITKISMYIPWNKRTLLRVTRLKGKKEFVACYDHIENEFIVPPSRS